MLHITKITLNNYRPYYGVTEIDIGEEQGLSIIMGDNGIGKTSLLKALKFALYGTFENDEIFKTKNEINRIAWEEGDYEMYVALDFKYGDGNEGDIDCYTLKRVVKKKPLVNKPQNDTDFDNTFTLFKNQIPLATDNAKTILKKIIPEKIAEYILFEGETISKYKKLLDRNRNNEIYASIREILGLKVLDNAQSDLENLLGYYESERGKHLRKNTKNAKERENLMKLEKDADYYKKQKEKAKVELDKYIEIREECGETLKNNERTNNLLIEETQLDTQIKNEKEKIYNYKNQIKDLIKNFKTFTKPLVLSRLQNVPDEILKIQENIKENTEKEKNISLLKSIMNSPKCKFCGHDVGDDEKNEIDYKIFELEKQKNVVSEEDRDKLSNYQRTEKIVNSLIRGVPDIDESKICDYEAKIQELTMKVDGLETKKKRIQKQIEELGGRSDLEEITKKYSDARTNIDTQKRLISESENKLKIISEQIAVIVRKLGDEVDLSDLNNKIETTKYILEIVNETIEKFSIEMRLKVQNDATDLFRRISHNDEYNELVFDEHYGLKLIDKSRRTVPNISSGYMTLITISLIYGLHRNSSLTGTIILDAPFSVLTDFHRERIISTFQELSPQVILLAYSDQINIEKIREEMHGKLINEFELYQNRQFKNYSYKTRVRKVG